MAQTHSSTRSGSSKTASDCQTFTLPDGRSLGYAEYGSVTGTPLVYFHGFPASRFEASAGENLFTNRNIRLLALDRPGFGLSTHDPKRRIIDWPADVEAFAKHIGLSHLTILGISGGGPYALACAEKLPPEMITAVGVLAGASPWDKGIRTVGPPWYAKLLYLGANYWPYGTRIITGAMVTVIAWIMNTDLVKRRLEKWFDGINKAKAAKAKKNDEEGHANKKELQLGDGRHPAEQREWMMGQIFEGFAQGTVGMVHEAQLLTNDWGIDFNGIRYDKVKMWHGVKDVNAPVAGIREIARRIPDCVLKEFADADHFQMGHHFDDFLGELIPDDATSTAAER